MSAWLWTTSPHARAGVFLGVGNTWVEPTRFGLIFVGFGEAGIEFGGNGFADFPEDALVGLVHVYITVCFIEQDAPQVATGCGVL